MWFWTGSFCYKRHCWDNPWNLQAVSASDFYSFNVGVWRNVWIWGKYILLYLGMMHQVGNFFSNGPGRKVLRVSGCAGVHHVSIFPTMHSGTLCWQLGTGCGGSIYTMEISKCCNSGHFLHWRANRGSFTRTPFFVVSFQHFGTFLVIAKVYEVKKRGKDLLTSSCFEPSFEQGVQQTHKEHLYFFTQV